MKKYHIILVLSFSLLSVLSLSYILINNSKNKSTTNLADGVYQSSYENLDRFLIEEEAAFRFLWDNTNTDTNSKGYGLVLDRITNPSMSSVASIGYALAGCGIGVSNGWITREEGYERALGTLETMYNNAQHVEGFFYHFLNMNNARRFGNCEVSVIDTAIMVSGALFAGEYFGGEVATLAEQIYLRVNWDWYRNPDTNQFYMEYKPENGSHTGSWGVYAEQLMLYFLGAASPTHPVPANMLYEINLQKNTWIGMPSYFMSPANSLFTHQYSHAWFDLRGTTDANGHNWYANSVAATLQSRQFSIDSQIVFKGFGSNSWGLTACDGPFGYSGAYGANPNNANDGTIAPAGAAGSTPFSPRYVAQAFDYFDTIEGLTGPYGYYDAYNLEGSNTKIMKDYLGIDKGITLVMIENARTGLVWEYMSKNKYVIDGMSLCGITSTSDSITLDTIQNVYISEQPYLGSTLHAEYEYLSLAGSYDGYVTYTWLRSESPKKEYTVIKDATTPYYTPTPDDVGMFLKVMVTPVNESGEVIGNSEASTNSFVVSKDTPSVSRDIQIKLEKNKKKVE